MSDSYPTLTFKESVRKKPIMYIGNGGLTELFKNILTQCVAITGTDKILFTFAPSSI